jgi:hypothetical protein
MKMWRITVMGMACAALICYLLVGSHIFLSFRAVFVPALALYLLSHCLRAVRIFLLLYDGKLRASEAIRVHFHAAGVSMLIPWKLGEIYRIFAFRGISPSFRRVVMSIWVERIWDTTALLLILLLPTLFGISTHNNGILILYMIIFIGISVFLFLVMPENINLVKRYLILRKSSERALLALIWVDRVHALLATAYRLLCYRIATMAWITCGIWILELLALWLVSTYQSTQLPQLLADQLSSQVSWIDQRQINHSAILTYHLYEVQVLVLIALTVSWSVLTEALLRCQAPLERSSTGQMNNFSFSRRGD